MVMVVKKDDNTYELNDNGTISPVEIYKDGLSLRLPTNSIGRTWVMRHLVDKTGKYELKERAPRKQVSKCSWTEFLTEEERKTIDSIKMACEERRQAMLKEKEDSSKDDFEAKLAKAKANYEKLLKQMETLENKTKKRH